jgi:hypothetical protein
VPGSGATDDDGQLADATAVVPTPAGRLYRLGVQVDVSGEDQLDDVGPHKGGDQVGMSTSGWIAAEPRS